MKKTLKIIAPSDDIIKNLIKQHTSKKYYVYLKHHNSITYVNNILKKNHELVKKGDIIEVTFDVDDLKEAYLLNIKLDIIYEDEYLMVINKPKNLNTIPSKKDSKNSLYNAILNYYHQNNLSNTIHFINRLDRKTSGLLLVAKDKLTALKLSNDLDNIERLYLAVAENRFDKKTDEIITYIKHEKGNIIRQVTKDNGQYAKTKYELLEEYSDNKFLIKLKLYTGRTHQIRLHMSHINHPLVGDELYNNYNDDDDLYLTSYHISFKHPYTNNRLTLSINPWWKEM